MTTDLKHHILLQRPIYLPPSSLSNQNSFPLLFFMCKYKRRTSVITTDSIIFSNNSRASAAGVSIPDCTPSSSAAASAVSADFEFTGTSTTSTQAALLTIKQTLATAGSDCDAQLFTISDIRSATDNFRARRHSSSSWRCVIRGHTVIVFQRSFRRPIHQPEFIRRLSMIRNSHHSSVVQLVGASTSGSHVYLVYRHVPGSSLSDCLRNPKNPNFTVLSTWISRVQIADDLAQGLDYIHHFTGADIKFVHNYIKSSSIIITESSLHARICHFGTAALCGEIPEDDLQKPGEISKEERIIGARGYMSPEFQITGAASQKTDVYAFGVVALELISGKAAVSYTVDESTGRYNRESVVEGAAEATGGGGIFRRWVDRRLKDSYPLQVAEAMTLLALECVDPDPDRRPDMGRVAGRISMLLLESRNWVDQFNFPTDFSLTAALHPR